MLWYFPSNFGYCWKHCGTLCFIWLLSLLTSTLSIGLNALEQNLNLGTLKRKTFIYISII